MHEHVCSVLQREFFLQVLRQYSAVVKHADFEACLFLIFLQSWGN